ncbi:bifunctional coenzyme A synthase-like protein [Dinothrombium tinctorium]|uniref:Bifunctional coenzyme A synthase-like protein n=2 Tax=Dinothrombium tinctorium TaxID=1965070 RepID=A0A3S3NRU3_9ACAR|nr:bifunctional coenzyme A synthase-like protein [Dinothrombium tinctorium]
MFSSGIVVLSFPVKKRSAIARCLKNASDFVRTVLYVKLEPNAAKSKRCFAVREPRTANDANDAIAGEQCFVSKKQLTSIVPFIYRVASKTIPSIDVRVLINHPSDLKTKPEILLTDCTSNGESFWQKYASTLFNARIKEVKFMDIVHQENEESEFAEAEAQCRSYDNVCLGGTFDNLHNGHKVFLSEALLRCNKSLTIGVTDIEMIRKKVLWELIEPVETRMKYLREYLEQVDTSVLYKIVPIHDPFGPAVEDDALECLVVSEETAKGGIKVNEVRESKAMKPLDLHIVTLLEESMRQSENEEDKVSSSTARLRKLGQLLREPEPRPNLPRRPYLIGLTGGIASGKSAICKKLQSLGAGFINCDILAHETYQSPESETYKQIVDAFGDSILDSNSNIDRKKLGSIVFSSQEKLRLLNSIVWPATEKKLELKIDEMKEKYEIIVVEAALLLDANWEYKVHEVWASIIHEEEALLRIQERNFTENEAKKRIRSQISNLERVKRANIIFCSLWDHKFTESQVKKAWYELLRRLSCF